MCSIASDRSTTVSITVDDGCHAVSRDGSRPKLEDHHRVTIGTRARILTAAGVVQWQNGSFPTSAFGPTIRLVITRSTRELVSPSRPLPINVSGSSTDPVALC